MEKKDILKGRNIFQIALMAMGCVSVVVIVAFLFMYLINIVRISNTSDSVSMDSYSGGIGLQEPYAVDSDLVYKEVSIPDSDNYVSSNTESKIRKSGTVEVKVENLDDSYEEVYSILNNYDGQLLSSYESGEGNDRSISMTLKVASVNFENIYAEVKDIEGEIIYTSYYTDDVTMEYTDLSSRLKNLQATETQLVSILESAQTVSDTLDVYSELTNIRSQIEVIQGQLEYMDSQVDYSYLTVYLTLSDTGKSVVDDSWKPWGVFKSAISSLVDFGKGIVNVLIWVVVFSPVVGIVVGVVVLLKKKLGKK